MKRSAPVEVTGLGCVSGAGSGVASSVKSLFSGERNPRLPRRFSSDHRMKSPVFEVFDDALPAWLPPEEELLRTGRLALTAAAEALADARWDPADLASRRVGVCVGTTVGSAMNNEEFYREYRDGGTPSMNPITRFLGSNPASAVAGRFGLAGPCQTVVNACSSGTDAIGIAAMWDVTRRLSGQIWAAHGCALILALCPLDVHYSTVLLPDAAMTAITSLSLWCVVVALERPGWQRTGLLPARRV